MNTFDFETDLDTDQIEEIETLEREELGHTITIHRLKAKGGWAEPTDQARTRAKAKRPDKRTREALKAAREARETVTATNLAGPKPKGRSGKLGSTLDRSKLALRIGTETGRVMWNASGSDAKRSTGAKPKASGEAVMRKRKEGERAKGERHYVTTHHVGLGTRDTVRERAARVATARREGKI